MHTPFSDDGQGNVSILFALMLMTLLTFVGGAIDYGLYVNAKRETSDALDSAVLAGAQVLLVGGTEEEAKAAADRFYEVNVVGRYPVVNDTVNFEVTDSNTIVSARGNAEIETNLLGLIGIETLPLLTDPGAGFSRAQIVGGGGSNMEVAVMLDMSGSMCADGLGPCSSSNKLDALKSATRELIDTVVTDDQSTYTSRLALVPFSSNVRLAPDGQAGPYMKKVTNLEPTWSGWVEQCAKSGGTISGSGETASKGGCAQYEAVQVNNWKVRPCVTERFYENGQVFGATDASPRQGYWLNGYKGSRFPLAIDSSDTAFTTSTGTSKSDPLVATHKNYVAGGKCQSMPDPNVVEPLSSDKSTLLSRLNSYEAYGETAGALAVSFAWYAISPNWSSIWPSDSEPAPYSDLALRQSNGQPALRKVAILLSDGVFNWLHGEKADQQTVSDHAKQVCANMKAAGIEVFTVGYDLDSLSSTEKAIALDTLKSCGNDLDHFYETLDEAGLKGAFRDIAVDLSMIVLIR